jgi:predicted oxidoreductase
LNEFKIAHTDLSLSRIGYGCMQLGGRWDRSPISDDERQAAFRIIEIAIDQGITLFDHADIYTLGKSEQVFGEFLQKAPSLRDRIVLQSKCGIRFDDDPVAGAPKRYDFSERYILESVDGILNRLHTDHLDILLLHRPDPLMEPEEVAAAFSALHRSGKVRYFGVSNHTAAQISLLKKYVEQPLIINQIELNLLHAHAIEEGIVANQTTAPYAAVDGLLDYCRQHDIAIQAWAPVAGGKLIDPPHTADVRTQQLAAHIAQIATEKDATREAIVLAWLLRHPAGIQPIVGTMHSARLIDSCRANDVVLSREEWYALFTTARGAAVP